MTMIIEKSSFIRYTRFRNLYQWDVKRLCFANNPSIPNPIRLAEILFPYKESISKEDLLNNRWRIISKINFSGELFLRDVSDTSAFKGGLCLVNPRSLIYSKINVRHGCVYYHPDNTIPFAVSSEYPSFRIDGSRVNGVYLARVLQSNYYKALFNQISSGISKSRVKPNDFLDIIIPMPSLIMQEAIAEAYLSKIHDAELLEQQAIKLEGEARQYMLAELGINDIDSISISPSNNKAFRYLSFVQYKSVSEWGNNHIYEKDTCSSWIYPSKKIEALCSIGSGGTPTRSNPNYYQGEIPWVKTGEVVNDVIFKTEEHINQDAIDNSSAKMYPKGSIIIAMYGQGDTRGRTAKLGIDATTNQACAVLYNIDNNVVLTDYLWYYLQAQYNDLRSLASGNNQPNLNAGKIKKYDVVIPPLEIQTVIVQTIKEQKLHIKHLKHQADILRKKAIDEFDKTIFE